MYVNACLDVCVCTVCMPEEGVASPAPGITEELQTAAWAQGTKPHPLYKRSKCAKPPGHLSSLPALPFGDLDGTAAPVSFSGIFLRS